MVTKPIREITTEKEGRDLKGWVIPKGTRLFVMKEAPKHPVEGYKVLVVRVDNGTGDLKLCPETVVRDCEILDNPN